MEFVIALLILSSMFLAAVTVTALKLFQALQRITAETVKVSTTQNQTLKHAMNLLSTKDPLAFQQVQAVTNVPTSDNYSGPYLSGDEIELLELQQREMDAAWLRVSEDLDE